MNVTIKENRAELGPAAAHAGAELLRKALAGGKQANIIVATGSSQFEMLQALTREPDIRWDRVTVFHLDEYVGLPITHPASFRLYLWERFARQLPLPVKMFHYVGADAPDPRAECRRLGALIREHPIDVAFIGIGENGHIAFNDPPADFETEEPYLAVELDEACRQQQLGEGWFPTLNDVPRQAISMSVRQILKSRAIICTVPDERKAEAVRGSVEGPVTPNLPGSILQKHANCSLFIDKPAASRLKPGKRP
jgi:glucosamine-6-phosphate deaminase